MQIKALLAAAVFGIVFFLAAGTASAWWDASWTYKKPINITGTGTELTNYQVALNVTYNANMQTDFDDLRFVDTDDSTEIDFWLEEKVDSSWAYVWVEVPTIAASGNTTVYMYYGNSSVSNASDIKNTFDIADDFNDASIDGSIWGTLGTVTESNGYAKVARGATAGQLYSNYNHSLPLTTRALMLKNNTASAGTEHSRFRVYESTDPTGDYEMIMGYHSGTSCTTPKQRSEAYDEGAYPGSYCMNTDPYNSFVEYIMIITTSTQDAEVNGVSATQWTKTYTDVDYGIGFNAYDNSIGVDMYVDWVYVKEYLATEPDIAVGSEETDSSDDPPIINISTPQNTTYYTTSIVFNFSVSDAEDATFHVIAYNDTDAIYDSAAYANNTLTSFTLIETGGQQNVTVWANDSAGNIVTSTILYTVDLTAPSLVLTEPAGAYLFNYTAAKEVPLKYTSQEEYSSVDSCWYTFNGTNTTIGSCANTTVATPSVGNYSLTLYSNNTGNLVNSTETTFEVDFENNFYARNKISLAPINTFLMTVWNSTYNISRNTVTGVVQFNTSELPLGNATVKLMATGYNDTFSTLQVNTSSQFNTTYDLSEASLTIKVYDEKDPSTQLTFNLTVSNATASEDYTNQLDFYDYWYNLPMGDDTLYIKSNNGTGYPQRTYTVTMSEYTAVTLYAYLLDADHGINVRFHIVSLGNAPISGAIVTAMKLINSSYVAVQQGRTDDSGTVTFWLDPTVIYSIKVEAAGYISKMVDIQPTSPDFTIVLGTDVDISFNHVFSTISYLIEPTMNSIDINQTQIAGINFTVSDSSSLLTYWGMNVTMANGTSMYSQVEYASPSGGKILASINLTGYNQSKIIANFYFKKSGQDEYVIQRTFFIYNINASSHSLWSIIESLGPTPAGVDDDTWEFTKQLAALMITMFAAAGTVAVAGSMGAAFVAVMVLGVFVVAGWFSAMLYVLILMAFFALLYLRSGL